MTVPAHMRTISFTPEMATAIWQGRKTQTRRPISATRIKAQGGRHTGDLLMRGAWHRAMAHPDGTVTLPCADGATIEPVRVRPAWEAGMTLAVRESVATLPGPRFFHRGTDDLPDGARWQNPRFMPLAACRMRLAVAEARFERLQDITDAGAQAEGIVRRGDARFRAEFAWLWNRIHGPEAWEANPWVVVLRFTMRRVRPEVAALAVHEGEA